MKVASRVRLSEAPVRAPNLRELAFTGDGERGALIDAEGKICWFCFPGWSDQPLLASLLGSSTTYEISPSGWHTCEGAYEEGTLIWRPRWVSGNRILECRDALAYPGSANRAVLLRRLTSVRGDWNVEVRLRLAAEFTHKVWHDLHRREDGWEGRLGKIHFTWTGGGRDLRLQDDSLVAELNLAAGNFIDLVLEFRYDSAIDEAVNAPQLWDATEAAWGEAVRGTYQGIARKDVVHSLGILRGLTSTSSGAMVAAPTTSLPERDEGNRDFDYRFTWIRDQCYAAQAAVAAGEMGLYFDLAQFIRARICDDGPKLSPIYAQDGSRPEAQHHVDLPGYPAGTAVVAGNNARKQFQLDAFGEILLALTACPEAFDVPALKASRLAVDAVAAQWKKEDAGIWELRPRLWTHSRMVCVAGLRRLARVAAAERDSSEWLQLADAIAAEIGASGVHPSGRWQRAVEDPRVDAALLLGQIRGAFAVDDPRCVKTLAAVRDELCRDGYVYRFPGRDEPLGAREGAFLLCNFWMAMACAQSGDMPESVRWFERARTSCGPAALLSEEYDVNERQLRGNIPQAFVHATLVETAVMQSEIQSQVRKGVT